jgi:uncharacterized protein (TIGR02453 family)
MKPILAFLSQLSDNNNREWFEAHRDQYEEARQLFEGFVKQMIGELTALEPSFTHLEPKGCIFRIYRDVRFSKDKRPYKNHFCAYFAPGGRKSTKAGYYLHLEPGGKSMLAGGMYAPPVDDLKKIRQEIDYNGQSLRAIMETLDFSKYYGGLSGEKVKTTPKGYAADHPDIEILKHKDFTAVHYLDDKLVGNGKLLQYSITVFRALKPFNDFLNAAVE